MTIGTKSVLFGVHQFILHPIVVVMAWIWLYHRPPGPRALFCILIHDLGYFGKANMDGPEGERHVEWAARVAHRLFDRNGSMEWQDFCLFHSRHYARNANRDPSRLCWADKMSIAFEPWWAYLPRAWLSGELAEYRHAAAVAGFVPASATHCEWYARLRDRLCTLGRERRGDAVPYANQRAGKD